jgi:anti-sigma factor RsiW
MSEAGLNECPFAQYVDAYCDGELDPALEEEMHRHVFACASCSAAVRQTVEIQGSIASIETRRLPEDVRNRIHSRVASSWDGGTMRLLRYMSGIAAVVLVGASIWLARMGNVAPDKTAPGASSTDLPVAQWTPTNLPARSNAPATQPSSQQSLSRQSASEPTRQKP